MNMCRVEKEQYILIFAKVIIAAAKLLSNSKVKRSSFLRRAGVDEV